MMLTLMLLAACKPSEETTPTPTPTPTPSPTVHEPGLRFDGPAPKNLLFLSIDTFRKDHTGFSGSDKGLTPFMDSIAAQGLVLDDHVQCADWTYGSTTCTLAGRTSTERGQMPRLSGSNDTRTKVPEGTELLATWLGQAGYTSALVSGNSWLSPSWGNAQGYDFYSSAGNAYSVRDTGLGLLRDNLTPGDPWFLHMHFMEPHAAYDPPEEAVIGEELLEPWPEDLRVRPIHYGYRDMWPEMSPEDQDLLEAHLRLLYEGEIRTIDYRLSDVWASLEAGGWLDDTLVVIWNDHGEQFWEHGNQTHAFKLYAEENDAFAVFWARNIVPGHYTEPTASIDLVPTVLDALDVPIPEVVTGWVLGTAPADRPRFGETVARSGAIVSILLDGWKMQYSFAGFVAVNDRNTDPGEQIELYDPTDPWQLELWSKLRPVAEAMAPLIVQPGPVPVWPAELP